MNVSLYNDSQLLDFSFFNLAVKILKGYLTALGKLCFSLLHLPVCPDLFCLFLIGHCNELIPCLWHARKSQNLYRHGWSCHLNFAAPVIHERSNSSIMHTSNK